MYAGRLQIGAHYAFLSSCNRRHPFGQFKWPPTPPIGHFQKFSGPPRPPLDARPHVPQHVRPDCPPPTGPSPALEEAMTIANPILRGFNPDPSILRVGDDYYIATSTFEWYPGVQIHHSRDLVHWRLLTPPLRRAGQPDMRGE